MSLGTLMVTSRSQCHVASGAAGPGAKREMISFLRVALLAAQNRKKIEAA
jgi:hypothetical protein